MHTTLALLALGLVLLLGGGDLLVRGASGLARNFGVASLVIGLTVVAFGTSAPELAVSLSAVTSGRGGLAFGNVIGSNLANIGLILGLVALYRPLAITGSIIAREVPMMLLVTVACLLLVLDEPLRGLAPVLDRADGLCLLLFFAIFLYTAVGDVVKSRMADPLVRQAESEAGERTRGRRT